MVKLASISYINNPKKHTAFHSSSSYRFGEQFLKKLYEPLVEFNNLCRPRFVRSMSRKLAKAPDERKPITQLYLNNIQLFEHDQRIKKKR